MNDRPIRLAVQSLKNRIPSLKDQRQDSFLVMEAMEKYLGMEEQRRRQGNSPQTLGEQFARKWFPFIKNFNEFFDSEPRFLTGVLNRLVEGVGDQGDLLDDQKSQDTYPDLDKIGRPAGGVAVAEPPAQAPSMTQVDVILKAITGIGSKIEAMEGRLSAIETKPAQVGQVSQPEKRGPGRPPNPK